MTEEPEEMLPEEGAAAFGDIEEVGAHQPVQQEQACGHGHRRKRKDGKHGSHDDHPGKERNARKRHAGRTQLVDGDNEVDGADRRRYAQDQNGQRPEIHAVAGRERLFGQRGVAEPAARRGAAQEEAAVEKQAAKQEKPVTQRIQLGKSHVARTDLERHQVVGQADRKGHGNQEDHRRAVHGKGLVVSVIAQQRVVGLRQLQPHRQRHQAAQQEEDQSRRDVGNADGLVIDHGQPLHDAAIGLYVPCRPSSGGSADLFCHCRSLYFNVVR